MNKSLIFMLFLIMLSVVCCIRLSAEGYMSKSDLLNKASLRIEKEKSIYDVFMYNIKYYYDDGFFDIDNDILKDLYAEEIAYICTIDKHVFYRRSRIYAKMNNLENKYFQMIREAYNKICK